MKKIISVMLALVFVLQLAACTQSPNDETKIPDTSAPAETTIAADSAHMTTTEEVTTEPTAVIPDKDMKGWTFRIYANVSSGYSVIDPKEESGEVLNDETYTRNRDMEYLYNFKLSVQNASPASNNTIVIQTLQNNTTAGDNAYQLYLPYTKTLINYAQFMLPFNQIPVLDYTKPWWFPDATEAFNVDGMQIALSGTFDLCVPSRVQLLMFNKDIFAELNTGYTMYDLVRENKWTLDKYIELGNMAAKDLNGDGVMNENDRFGLSSHVKGYYGAFINGFGITFATRDAKGYPVFSGGSDSALVDIIQKWLDIIAVNPNLFYNTSTSIHSAKPSGMYPAGQTLFYSGAIASIANAADYDFQSGYVPFPMLHADQGRYYCQTAYGHSPTLSRALPKDEWENVGILMEAFAYSTYTKLLPIYKEETLKLRYADSPEDSEMVDLIWDSIFYDFGILCWESYIADKIHNQIFLKGTDSVVSYLESIKPVVQKYADNLAAAVAAMKESSAG